VETSGWFTYSSARRLGSSNLDGFRERQPGAHVAGPGWLSIREVYIPAPRRGPAQADWPSLSEDPHGSWGDTLAPRCGRVSASRTVADVYVRWSGGRVAERLSSFLHQLIWITKWNGRVHLVTKGFKDRLIDSLCHVLRVPATTIIAFVEKKPLF
jgi:hypothetical protein